MPRAVDSREGPRYAAATRGKPRMLLVTNAMPALAAILVTLTIALCGAAAAQSGGGGERPATPPPAAEAAADKVRALLALVDDPAVRGWLERQAGAAEAGGAPGPAPAADPAPAPATLESSLAEIVAAPAMAVRHHVQGSLAALPTLPAELARAGAVVRRELAALGLVGTALLALSFAGLGLAVERLYWRATRGFRARLAGSDLDTVHDRLAVVGRRLAFGLGWVTAFTVGSLGAFLPFEWPPLLRDLVIRCLLVLVAVRLTAVAVNFLLAPKAARFRILPASDATARHWSFWLPVTVGWYAASRLATAFLDRLGTAADALNLATDLLALAWLALLLLAVWRRPALRRATADPAERAAAHGRTWLVSAGLVLLCLLVPLGAYRVFSTALVAAALPALLYGTRLATAHVLRPPGAASAAPVPPLAGVWLERGLRAFWIIGAVLLVGWIWEADLRTMAGGGIVGRLLRGALDAVLILIVADLLWQLLRGWIDRQLAETQVPDADEDTDPEAAHRRARLRTLLPIARNVLLVVLSVMAVLMALAALGVEVGPLVAGAGVAGVAIGFGAQTLVKDIISGVFFLLDDAFRVGEYIESGDTRGTVESFSLRSVKLRHHRGYLHTVPFGSLEKITNYSRDWVIDKIIIGVPYDTDLDRVRRIAKQVGKELQDNPELGPSILEPLKMQGVEEYGDYAIKLRFKMRTKPGEQFVPRRLAYALLKKAFDENGIRFAFPTVQVAGGGEGEGGGAVAAAAAAQATVGAPKPAAA